MACFHPLPAWRARRLSATGKRGVSFKIQDGFSDMRVELPCGRCPGCVQDRANEWALRCEHEARMHRWNWFVTLTYKDDPESLQPSHLVDFFKRFRRAGKSFRYFACGEYGERFLRPHYHVLFFGLRFDDLVRRVSGTGKARFSSAELERAWGHGFCTVDPFSPATAQYVCNYVRKKSSSEEDYQGRTPEFQVMSRRPGIGGTFIRRFMSDVYPDGFVTRPGGIRARAPRFYDKKVEAEHPRMWRRVKRARAAAAAASTENTGSRLLVREALHVSKEQFYTEVKGRPFEKGGTP